MVLPDLDSPGLECLRLLVPGGLSSSPLTYSYKFYISSLYENHLGIQTTILDVCKFIYLTSTRATLKEIVLDWSVDYETEVKHWQQR